MPRRDPGAPRTDWPRAHAAAAPTAPAPSRDRGPARPAASAAPSAAPRPRVDGPSAPPRAPEARAPRPAAPVVAAGGVASFDDLGLSPAVRAAVAEMGITTPTPIQAAAIPPLLAGRDVIAQARTGSGKTLGFALPLVERLDPTGRGVQALVLVPTRELAIQVGDVVRPLAAARRLKLTLLYGGRSLGPERQLLLAGAQIVVATPGRTLDHLRQGNLTLRYLTVFVLDEADEMLDRGFAPDVERILGYSPPSRQTALFSATVPEWVMGTAAKHLKDPVSVRVDQSGEAPPEIEHVVHELPAELKLDALCDLLNRRGDGPAIVFGRTKHGVKKLAKKLQQLGYPAEALQGNLSQNARERVMAGFRSGEVPILVATNVAARGIDVTGIEAVINFEVPESAELFTHRVGRTGRMGRAGTAITLVSPDEAKKMREIERALGRRLPREPWTPDPSAPRPAMPEQAPGDRPAAVQPEAAPRRDERAGRERSEDAGGRSVGLPRGGRPERAGQGRRGRLDDRRGRDGREVPGAHPGRDGRGTDDRWQSDGPRDGRRADAERGGRASDAAGGGRTIGGYHFAQPAPSAGRPAGRDAGRDEARPSGEGGRTGAARVGAQPARADDGRGRQPRPEAQDAGAADGRRAGRPWWKRRRSGPAGTRAPR